MKQDKLTENEAWGLFEKTSGKSRELYNIERVKNCWVIRMSDKNNIPMGAAPWVVTDDGKVFRVGYPLSLEKVIADNECRIRDN